MRILGISAFYHDSAAALIEDGTIRFAAEEERFSRVKHDNQFPFRAIQFCLAEAGISIDELDAIAYYEKPLRKFERILCGFIATYPFSILPFVRAIPEWLGRKITIERIVRTEVGFTGELFFIPHHYSHAAAAYFTSPYDAAAVLTVDGVGEYQTTALWNADGTTLTELGSLEFPHSLGLLYSTFTAFLGFKVNEDEYKVMGLAAYGIPRYVDDIRSLLIEHDDGSFALKLKYFGFQYGSRMWSRRFERLLGSSRTSDETITQRHEDIAASIQVVTESLYTRMLHVLHERTGANQLCVGGGVALNALANGKIHHQTPFRSVHIFGPAGDSGAAIGAALSIYHQEAPKRTHAQYNLYLGTEYSDEAIESILAGSGLPYERVADTLATRTAELLQQGAVIGWFQGRMEFGPRALGARSILALPAPAAMKTRINEIKHREQFRPFAVSILEEHAREYFELPNQQFPHMNFCFPVRKEKQCELAAAEHHDGTCRIQTVSADDTRYRTLLEAVHAATGSSCVLNTSFNVAGEPLVESPEQALYDFTETSLDHLVIGSFIVSKSPKTITPHEQ